MSLEHSSVSFLAKFIAVCFELGKKIKYGLLKHYALCDDVVVCFSF